MTTAASPATAVVTTTTTTTSASESSCPSWVLLNAYARVGICPNETTAHGKGRNDLTVCVSLVTERPPLPSNLYVHCPGARFREIPYLLSMVGDLILIHVYTGPSVCAPSRLQSDFFIYRADPKRPTLDMLTHPKVQVSRDYKFSIFPRGEDHYTVAALIPSEFKKNMNIFLLHLYDSETKIWSRKELFVEESLRKELPVDLPINYRHILQHSSSTVVALGEKIGWVDLWSGIMFFDMLSKNHSLSWVPLPLPLKCTKPYADPTEPLGVARFHRGIAFINEFLRLAEVEFNVVVQVPYVYDEETGSPCSETRKWTITTWTNKEMSSNNNSYDAWHKDCTLQASDIFLGDHSESELPPLALQNLFVSEPIFDMNENDGHVVYLTARTKFMHPDSWVLAIDMRDRKVRSVVKLPREKRVRSATYCSCSISK